MLSLQEFKQSGVSCELPNISEEDDEEQEPAISPKENENSEGAELVRGDLPEAVMDMGRGEQNEVLEAPGIYDSAIAIVGGDQYRNTHSRRNARFSEK